MQSAVVQSSWNGAQVSVGLEQEVTALATRQAEDGPSGPGVTQTPFCGTPAVGGSVGVHVEGETQVGEPLRTHPGSGGGVGPPIGTQPPRQPEVVQERCAGEQVSVETEQVVDGLSTMQFTLTTGSWGSGAGVTQAPGQG